MMDGLFRGPPAVTGHKGASMSPWFVPKVSISRIRLRWCRMNDKVDSAPAAAGWLVDI